MADERARRFVVTGGAGFIGSHVAARLLDQGHGVVVVDDLSTGKRSNVPDGADLVERDITDPRALHEVVASMRPHALCHLAAQASVTFSVRRPDRDLLINVLGTLNVLEAAREVGASVVFASTGGALYGEDAPIPTTEEAAARPGSPYGASKLAGEAYVSTWSRLHGMDNVVLRLGNVYGPRQEPHGEAGVVAIFSAALHAGRPPTVFGYGAPTRDYVYVGDVADAFVAAAESRRAGTYNVGTGTETSVNELLASLQEIAGTALEPDRAPLRQGELQRSALDSALIGDALGWRPQLSLAEGLAITYESFR